MNGGLKRKILRPVFFMDYVYILISGIIYQIIPDDFSKFPLEIITKNFFLNKNSDFNRLKIPKINT